MSHPSANNVTPFDFTPSPSKVTRFREDKRPAVISAIRSLAMTGLLATLVFCIFHYQEDLNVENLRRMVTYVDKLTFSGGEIDTFTFDAGLSTAVEAFDVGIATCSGGSFRFIPPFEGMDFSEQIKYGQPQMEPGGKSIFVYDLGGKGITRFNSYSKLAETTMESKILSLSANLDGQCAVVTDEEGYRTALTVFDKRFNVLYKWQTSEHFAFLTALSPDGRTAAALCIGQQGGDPDFYIRYQPLNGDECTVTIDLGDRKVYSMEYASDDRLLVLCEDGLYAYDPEGVLQGYYGFPSGSLIAFAHDAESDCAISLNGDKGDTSRLLVLDSGCNVRYEGVFEGNVRTLDYAEGVLTFLSGSQLYRADLADSLTRSTELSGVRDLLITGGGNVAAVMGDCARIVDFTEGE